MRRLLLFSGLLAVALPVAVLAILYHDLHQPLDRSDEEVVLEVPSGISMRGVAERLTEDAGLHPATALALRVHARVTGRAQRLQSGEYRLKPGDTPLAVVDRIVRGDVVQYRLTLVEGWTFHQVRNALERHPAVEQTLLGLSDKELMTALNRGDEHPEGRFYPSTYQFPRGTTDTDILRRAYRRMEQRLDVVWAERAEDLPLDEPYEALILASIIERETGVASERRRVAGVFARRLERGMRLQTDPTVIYGLGEDFEGRLRRRHLERDTPYNTYTRHGLPPTPIAMPGSASLEAAVNPKPGTALYFVSRGDGTHHFSDTLEEHNRAVRRYILGAE